MLFSIIIDKDESTTGEVHTIYVSKEVDKSTLIDIVWNRDGTRATPFLIIIIALKNIRLFGIFTISVAYWLSQDTYDRLVINCIWFPRICYTIFLIFFLKQFWRTQILFANLFLIFGHAMLEVREFVLSAH